MDHGQEQADEVEALESIFPDELTVNSPTDLEIVASYDAGVYQDETFTGSLSICVEFTPEYPETAPKIRLEQVNGQVDESKDLEKAHTLIAETIDENLGMPMIFTVHSAVMEWLEELLEGKKKFAEDAVARAERAAVEAEIARYTAGTQVTKETFKAWRERFDAEMKEKNAAGADAPSAKGGKKTQLTGRQMFERNKNMANSERSITQSDDVVVDTSLFEGMDLDDVDEADLA
eukprot:m.1165897 g.1165897  ORF g.1165897 m.1165897 type:complete len:233 (+) comp24504_c0_seq1:148-846(+)